VLAPGQLYVGLPSTDAITQHLAAVATSAGAIVRNDVKVRRLGARLSRTMLCVAMQ
jgi:hypothetical protein